MTKELSIDLGKPILTLAEAKAFVEFHQQLGRTVVFTNGCFDILHAGHVRYLNEAKALGDVLVVAINSDASVRRIKGEKRPINSQNDRAYILKNLKAVDAVLLFEDDTPLAVIETLLPDVLVKGADWAIENIVGKDVVEAHGGRVQTVSFLEGRSTTGTIEKILKAYA
ncbi:MAG: D-glycero-beta-D-manno-heptose 1-phosphate adenylyltransferase [Chloroherpetonaceae bacterium]|nr:D-glycero-beta-D-manno-heptose 1-phosphate adenylyltransferase [Chloroherpetonaceae bacterium]MDW8438461.1 D-glycero-beta-D-manno-heptose 1-phosphate adenylyltransferase [Chloroherpetonaceae bacterium]